MKKKWKIMTRESSTNNETGRQPSKFDMEQKPKADTLDFGTVLIVDDEPDVLSVTRVMLEHQGFDVLTAENGKQCLEILSSDEVIDIVLLDMTMPGISAKEILHQGHQLRPNLPVVLCSGSDELAAMRLFEEENLSGFLMKPFSLHGILAALNTQTNAPAKDLSANV